VLELFKTAPDVRRSQPGADFLVAEDAKHLLAVREALKALATTRVTKNKIANAKELLAQR
jgi:formate-dependent nitrite reductase cytochrome c552 subunit